MSALAEAVAAATEFPFIPLSDDLGRYFDLDDVEVVWAREYLRVSKDESGRARSNSEQHADHVGWAARKRWQLGEPYEDVGSASNRKRRRRADFDQLMADLRSGTFGAHVLMIWEPSRGSREVPEWYALLGLCQQQRVFIFVMNLRRLFNPRVARDWKDLMNMAVDAEHEVMQLVERQERANDADAAAGTFTGGRRPFGYDENGTTLRRGLQPGTVDEVALIEEAVRRVITGDSVRSICADWNRQGILTSYGNDWHPRALNTILRSDRIAGLRSHKGRTVGKANWPAIIDETTRRRLFAALGARTTTATRGRTPWALTGWLYCSCCEHTLSSFQDSRGVKRYRCRKAPGYKGCGAVTIAAGTLDEHLGKLISLALVDADARRAAGQLGDSDDAEEQTLLAQIEADRLELADAITRRKVSKEQGRAEADALDRFKSEVEARLAAKVRNAPPVLDLILDDPDVRGKPWPDKTVDEKRRLLGTFIDRVIIGPATLVGSPHFDDRRVDVRWRI